eukprot:8849231-Pyramimonas_sp.AAC.1
MSWSEACLVSCLSRIECRLESVVKQPAEKLVKQRHRAYRAVVLREREAPTFWNYRDNSALPAGRWRS